MAKVIHYNLCTKVNRGTEENPRIEEILSPVELGWNALNEELAKMEAYQGEYTIEDDGQPEPATDTQRIAELEEALELLLSGVTE